MDQNSQTQNNSKKILVVDDDMYIRDIYEEVLKAEGFIVETAIDGEAGLAKLQKGGYSVILLDVMMPKKDGIGVLTSLQAAPPEIANGPILLLTNLGHDTVIKEALRLGAVTYLNKADMTPEDLLQQVKKYVN
ncbi:MAG: hypothetical protein QG600_91 [Patescibacteria group bacterium]|jgi:CheY-like chemotaxis protein|nr:hypothetical protein [Patescibacteria group bacterium]